MKAKTSIRAACKPGGANDSHALRQNLCWALAGFGAGISSAATYLLLGGDYFLNIPTWASLVFYPGFLAGFKVHAWGLSEQTSKVAGVLVVGLAYAALVVLARFLWFALKYCRKSAALREDSE